MEYMKYSRAELNVCAVKVKEYIHKWKWHKMKKSEFFTRACDLQKCYTYAENNLNGFLFGDNTHMKKFLNAAYECKRFKNSELEDYERTALKYICNELNDILTMINHEPEKYEKF